MWEGPPAQGNPTYAGKARRSSTRGGKYASRCRYLMLRAIACSLPVGIHALLLRCYLRRRFHSDCSFICKSELDI